MDQKTREAVIGKDMNRADLPTHRGASQKPRPAMQAQDKPDQREAAMDKIINSAMSALARDEAEISERKTEKLNEFLLEQVAGKPIAEIRCHEAI